MAQVLGFEHKLSGKRERGDAAAQAMRVQMHRFRYMEVFSKVVEG